MSDEENVLRITFDDIQAANQLSLACPMCASPVEDNVLDSSLRPVSCAQCGTHYHSVCWQHNGGSCAVLGCNCTEHRVYGVEEDSLRISIKDLPSEADVKRRNQQLKRREKQQRTSSTTPPPTDQQRRGFWGSLFNNILRAFGVRQ